MTYHQVFRLEQWYEGCTP